MRSDLPDSVYAFPKQRKEPMTDARHVRNALARFDQVTDASEADRALAFANVKKAAKYYDVDVSEESWQDLGVKPQAGRRQTATRGAATRKRTGTAKKASRKAPATRKRPGITKTAARKAASTTRKKTPRKR